MRAIMPIIYCTIVLISRVYFSRIAAFSAKTAKIAPHENFPLYGIKVNFHNTLYLYTYYNELCRYVYGKSLDIFPQQRVDIVETDEQDDADDRGDYGRTVHN
jgi:hypothetical protein